MSGTAPDERAAELAESYLCGNITHVFDQLKSEPVEVIVLFTTLVPDAADDPERATTLLIERLMTWATR